MTLEQVSYLSQTVAAAAVVVSIVYLAIQVRQAERNQRAQMQQARTERGMVLAASMESPHFAAIWVKVTTDNPDVNAMDISILTSFLRRWALNVLDAQANHALSLLSDEALARACAAARWGFAYPIARAVWTATVRETFTPDDAARFEALAILGAPLTAGADNVARTRSAREVLLAGA
ncbi:hypothetical protein [Phenylobacterium sp.]|uniref:hypothetical protein n=1 Tax=Phenylobacterium sp. TaxID=1871053 RepID=UPI002C18BFBA|nr:hypothetical protein [Phenylobacterium sp.]HLZ76674.1 hypothetical protein [Phenylobacterium sp.]